MKELFNKKSHKIKAQDTKLEHSKYPYPLDIAPTPELNLGYDHKMDMNKASKTSTKKIGIQSRRRVSMAAITLALFGALILGAAFFTDHASPFSMLLTISGANIVALSILFFFLTPYKYINSEVCDAIYISNTELTCNILSPLFSESSCTYIPSNGSEPIKIFIPTSLAYSGIEVIENISYSGGSDKKGVFLTPPGYGLFTYSKSIGALYSSEDLANEIKDVVVKSLELAGRVEIEQDPDSISVKMYDIANSGMCNSIRKKYHNICHKIGCPICSMIACMVVEGTGRRAIIDRVMVDGKMIRLTFKLM